MYLFKNTCSCRTARLFSSSSGIQGSDQQDLGLGLALFGGPFGGAHDLGVDLAAKRGLAQHVGQAGGLAHQGLQFGKDGVGRVCLEMHLVAHALTAQQADRAQRVQLLAVPRGLIVFSKKKRLFSMRKRIMPG